MTTCDYDWVEIIDPNSSHTFFANPITGECLWEKPITGTLKLSDPEGDWWELWDDKNNLPYYYHTQTCATEWTKPVDKQIVPLAKIQSSSVFAKRMSVIQRETEGSSTPMELKRNSRSMDLPVTTSLRRTLHQRSNSDGKNDTLHVQVTSPPTTTNHPQVQPNHNNHNNSSSLLSSVLPHSTSTVFKMIGTPSRKQSVRSQKSDTGEPRPRRLSHFSAFSNFSSKPLRNLVGRPTSVQTHFSVSQPINNPDAAASMNSSNIELVSDSLQQEQQHQMDHPLARISPLPPPTLPDGLRNDINQFAIDGFAKKYFSTHKRGILFRRRVPMREMLQWTKDSIKKPLIMMNNELYKDVLKCFKMIQMIMGDRSRPRNTNDIDDYQQILGFGIMKGQMRDEIYVQVCKQLHNNPTGSSIKKGWEILCVISIAFPPSKNLESYLTNFVQENHHITDNQVNIMSTHVSNKLKRICKRGAKGKVLTAAEIQRAKEAPFKPSVFGESLHFIMNLQGTTDLKIPQIVPFLADAVYQLNGQQSEGIFRVPGDADDVTDLRVRIENGIYDITGITDPNVPASLLKYWLRDLAEPLIPTELYDTCLANSEDEIQAINIINQLPDTNRRITLYMISFLQEFNKPNVIEQTLMNINNLAMVFAPNFLRCPGESLTTVFENSKYEQFFLRTLIQHLQVSRHDCAFAPSDSLSQK